MFFFIYGVSKLVRTVLSLIFMKANNKTVTIVRFINSTIRYLAAFVLLFAILAVLGVDATTILASAGILALVVGLGAQTLIADIIAGLSIVFEEQFDVGDVIVVDGFRGVVYEIGLATTKVVDFSGNLKSIRNSGINTVINQSHDLSSAIAYCSVDYSSDLAYVRKVVEEELLKQFKAAIPSIIGDPKYLGVSELEDSGIQLMFLAKCNEDDRFSTQRAMNEIAVTVLTKAGIQIPFPQIVVSQRKDK
jgi:small conductance mechanosensitive channel